MCVIESVLGEQTPRLSPSICLQSFAKILPGRYLRYFRAYAYLTDYLASDYDCVAARLGLGRENAVGHG